MIGGQHYESHICTEMDFHAAIWRDHAGAVAGIVVGTTLGAGLTALIGWIAYTEYQKRRLKRFYK